MKDPTATYRISHLLLLAAMLGVGWWSRGFTQQSHERLSKQAVEDRHQVDRVLESGIWINLIYGYQSKEQDEVAAGRQRHLIGLIYRLALTEPLSYGNAPESFLLHASNGLRNLDVQDADELREVVRKARIIDEIKASFLDDQNPDHDQVADFVDRAFAFSW